MKRITFALMLIVAFAGCNQNSRKTANTAAQTTIEAVSPTDVIVYYFRGKQRCKTCVEVGNVARGTIEKAFWNNDNVHFIEINTSEKGNDALIEKYEVTWNALIIAKGEDFIEVTDQAFAAAVKNTGTLVNLIMDEVNKRLQ